MTIMAERSWIDDGFSIPHGERNAMARCDTRASIIGLENRQEYRYPELTGCPVEDFDIRDHIGAIVGELATEDSATEDSATEDSAAEGTEWTQVLTMWLRWSDAYEEITSRMYRDGENAAHLESLMDEMDQLRQAAVELSEGLLDH
jgi:hypothetical protein